jgi:hypothetical protein
MRLPDAQYLLLLTASRFVPPVKNEVLDLIDHQQNVWGAENKFM